MYFSGKYECKRSGCEWKDYDNSTDYGYYYKNFTTRTDILTCESLCSEDPECGSFEWHLKGYYCSWWKYGKCQNDSDYTLQNTKDKFVNFQTCRKGNVAFPYSCKLIMFNDIIIPLFCLKCCFMSLDAVDCVWNEFEEWSACTKDCGGGKRSRSRTIKTEASNGGRKCTGVTSEQESCNTHGCKGKHCTFFHISNYIDLENRSK